MSVSAKDLVIVFVLVSSSGLATGDGGTAGVIAKGLLDANGLLDENGFDDPEEGVENGFAPAVDAPAPPNRKLPAFTASFSSFFSSCFFVIGSRGF